MKEEICLIIFLVFFSSFLTFLFYPKQEAKAQIENPEINSSIGTEENITYTPSSETHCDGNICETINYETNEKIVTNGIITMISPNEIVCRWSDPNSLWKDCEVIIEVNNSDTKNDLILKGDTLLAKFLKVVQNFTVYTTYDYTLYNDTILNRTCFDNLNVTPEERERILENKSLCFYNITRKNFYNFKQTTKLDKIYKNSVIGIKLVFKSPIIADAGVYLKNHFNFTLLSDYNLTLDPDISACSVLDTDYGVYTLTADISNSGATACINITANHVILNCQGHTIDGTDASSTYGIYVKRSSATTTNETIKNCVMTDWGYGIYIKYSNSNTLSNITANSNYWEGIWLTTSDYNTLSNITANSNGNYDYGIWLTTSDYNTLSNITANSNYDGINLDTSDYNTLSNITVNSNSFSGIYLTYSDFNIIKNSIIQNNSYGIYLSGAGSTPNLIYNNLFNNTMNFYFTGLVYENYWNTTRQTGTRIYSPGTEIGGNYWTNPTGNGYSDTCTDADTDGFCDDPYTLDSIGPNIDYLPLSNKYSAADTTPPTYSLNSTNSTIAGTAVLHSLKWTDNAGLSYAIFSFDNCTGNLQNITGMSLSGTSAWSNFTVVINSTVGCTIRWCVYANDTSNNWNGTSCSNPFNYVTTSANQPPFIYQPKTYDENLNEKTSFANSSKVVIRVNVTDPQGASDISKVLITILNSTNGVKVNNATMTSISSITNGYTYEYNYTLSIDADRGTWTIKVFANDTQNAWGSNSTTFSVYLILSKEVTQQATVSSILQKTGFVKRISQLTLTISTTITKLIYSFKTVIQYLSISPILTKLTYGFETITQTITILPTLTEFEHISKAVIQIITTSPILTKLTYSFKTIIQYLSISSILIKLTYYFEAVSQSVTMLPVLTEFEHISKIIIQIIDISETVARLNAIISKQIIQITNVQPVLKRVGVAIRISTQTVKPVPTLKEIRIPYISPIVISIATIVTRGIVTFKNILLYLLVQPISFSGYAHIKETEGPYVPVKCSEWGDITIHKCKVSCPDCYSEINFIVPWIKTVTLNNTGNYVAYDFPINATIPKSTNSANDIKLYDPDGISRDFTANIAEGYINWTATILPGETQTWTIKFNTTAPKVSEYNETVGIEFTKWHNVSSAIDIDYEKVWDYTYLEDPSIYIRFYDNTTGTMEEFTGRSAWGPPVTKDLNGNGYADYAQWMIPKISANTDKQLVIKSSVAKVSCEVENKTILNAPVLAWENVEWRWDIKCTNLVDITLSYSQDFRIPLESSRIYLDGKPTEPGFLTIPPYGPYVTLSGSIGPYENKTHTLEFLTPGVTVDIPPASFPSRFWVGEKANLILDITAKNWASETVNETQTKINIVYGENVKLFKEGFLVDSIDEVRGYYTLKIYNMTPYESRSYMLSYMTPVADAKLERYSRRIINGSQYLVYPFKVWSLASFPVSPLFIRIKSESPFRCSDIYQIWEVSESEFLNPTKPIKILNYECENTNTTLVELSPLTLGQTRYYDVFVLEVEKPTIPFTDVLYNFFEWLINLIKNFISIIISAFQR